LAAPFPWFGGKRRAAAKVWEAIGDVGGYVEPFAGSAAVLLARPAFRGRRVETINDADGWLVNAWRSIQLSPDAVADHAHGPVTEVDYHARLAWLQERRTPDLVAWLEGDPEHHDAKAAGWWLYVLACGIGDPFGPGPWRVVDGHLRDARELPHLGDAGQGVNRELPHLGNAGRGVIAAYMAALARRLARVRIVCGDWRRALTPAVTRATAGNGTVGIFLDPPYTTGANLYAESGHGVANAVREWCLAAPRDYRIVLAGYLDDHDAVLGSGWRKEAGRAGGGAGYCTDPRAGRRERLWLSPACVGEDLLSYLAVA
jgi:hypothetical protein